MRKLKFSVALADAPTAVKVHNGPNPLQAFIDQELERARAEGFAAGQANGSGIMDQLLARMEQDHEQAVDELASTAIALAQSIATRIVRLEIEDGRYALERIVRECLGSSGIGRGKVSVHLHPTDAASLADVTFRAGTTIEEDPEVARGDVHVETPMGLLVRNIEHTISSIVDRIKSESGA